jgi:hypothetical protein
VARFVESTLLPFEMAERLVPRGGAGALPPEAMEITRQPL